MPTSPFALWNGGGWEGVKKMAHKRTTPKIFRRAKELRRNMTPAERRLWAHLRAHRLGDLGFRAQHALGRYIVDFACPGRKIIIELDGDSHANQVEYDAERTAWLEAHGYQVRRFTNAEVTRNLDAVLTAILEACHSTPPQPSPSESADGEGE